MRVAICDDNQQDIERIRRYTLRMIDYAVEYVFYTRPEELLRECADAEQKPDMCFVRHRWHGCWQYCWCPQGLFFYSVPCTARTENWIKRNKSILAEKQG